jgi:hypothetical protein
MTKKYQMFEKIVWQRHEDMKREDWQFRLWTWIWGPNRVRNSLDMVRCFDEMSLADIKEEVQE